MVYERGREQERETERERRQIETGSWVGASGVLWARCGVADICTCGQALDSWRARICSSWGAVAASSARRLGSCLVGGRTLVCLEAEFKFHFERCKWWRPARLVTLFYCIPNDALFRPPAHTPSGQPRGQPKGMGKSSALD